MWKKAPVGLVETFEAVRPGPPAEHKKMFGYPCCFVNGNMFMGLHEDHMVLRLGDDERKRLLAMHGAEQFEPMPGRPMKEYVVVPPSLIADPAHLSDWVGKSLAYAANLPPKGKVATGRAAAKIRPSTAPAAASPASSRSRKSAGSPSGSPRPRPSPKKSPRKKK